MLYFLYTLSLDSSCSNFWLKKFWWMQMAKEIWCHPPKCWRYFFSKFLWGSSPFIFIKFLLRICHFLINPPPTPFPRWFCFTFYILWFWTHLVEILGWNHFDECRWLKNMMPATQMLERFFLKILWGSPPFIFIKFLIRIYHFLINPTQVLFWGGFALLFIYSDFGLFLWKFCMTKFWWMQMAKKIWCQPPKCWRDFF